MDKRIERVIDVVSQNYALGSIVAFSGKGKTLRCESADEHARNAVEHIMLRNGAKRIEKPEGLPFVVGQF